MVFGLISTSAHGIDRSEALTPGGAYLIFAGKFGGDLSPEQIRKVRTLSVGGCAAGSRIFTYKLSITHKGQEHHFKASSDQLSTAAISLLQKLQKGDHFQFSKVKARTPSGNGVHDVHCKTFRVI